jgi:O-antigen ligase
MPVALVGAVFLASYLSWRPSIDIMFTAADALFLVAAGLLAASRRIPLQPFGALTPLWLIAFATMMTGLLIGSLLGNDPFRWFVVAAQYCFSWVVLPYLLLGHARRPTHRLVVALLVGIVAMETVGIVVYFTYTGSFEEARRMLGLDFLSGGGRLGAFATDANWNGAAIAMALPFAYFLAGKGLIKARLLIVVLGILLCALLLTASATAFGSVLVGIVIFAVAGAVRPRVWAMVAAIALIGVAAESQFGLPRVFEKRVGSALENGDITEAGTFGGRVALIKDAWNLVNDHMLVGVGVDQHRVVSKLRAPVHNMYLLIWVEGGLLALIGWLGMIAVAVITAFIACRDDRLAGALALSVLATFVLFSTASPHMYARLWATPALLAIAIARNAAPLTGARATLRAARARQVERARALAVAAKQM